MKKLLLTGTLLLVTLVIGAQIKVAPKMKKGDKKTYVAETLADFGKLQAKTTIETRFEVEDATADGYIIQSMITDVKVETDTTDMTGRIVALSSNLTKGMNTRMLTDKDGKVLKILDFEKTMSQAKNMVDKLVDIIQLPDMISKDMIKNAAISTITEDKILNDMTLNNSPFALNGKTIATGTQDETSTKEGIKMKRTFTVNADGSIASSSKIDMSISDMADMIIDMAASVFPDQTEEVKQQIRDMVKSGVLKISATDNATYTLGKDGWVETITTEAFTESMGQKTKVTTKVRQKK